MMRKLWSNIHWLIGITAGVVLAIVGITGAMMSFEEQILRTLNSDYRTVEARAQTPLTPAQLMEGIQASQPNERIASLIISSDPTETARVNFAPRKDAAGGGNAERGPRGEQRFVDPYTGAVLEGKSDRGQSFFRSVRSLHRWLTVGEFGHREIGKQLVGASTVLALVLGLSGLYLRWPRRVTDWRAWFTLKSSLKGRGFLWQLHTVAGTYVLFFYLIMASTGLYWSYEWYRDGLFALTGTQRPAERERGGESGSRGNADGSVRAYPRLDGKSLDLAWQRFEQETSPTGFRTATVTFPQRAGRPIEIRYIDADPPHTRASNTLAVDTVSGAVLKHERYADKPAGAKLMASMFPLHSGIFFGLPGIVLYMLASLLMPLFAVTGWMMYLDRRKIKKRVALAAQRAFGA